MISVDYLAQNILLHRTSKWGNSAGKKWGLFVLALIHRYKINSVLDYGCGKGTLKVWLDKYREKTKQSYSFVEYDPAIKDKDNVLIDPAQLVVCIDVLEHVELKYIENVIHYLEKCILQFAFITISLREANTVLPDGRNAHQIVRDKIWWLSSLEKIWEASFEITELPFHYLNELVLFVQRNNVEK